MTSQSQGKFDALTKELITHVLGFKEGEENSVRSEQFVLSNLLYHHCLAVNSHAVRRSLDGLALKFTIHGQHQRATRLKALVTQFLASPFFKDHYETDLEWSLLSLLLHLSNSPTQVPLQESVGELQDLLTPLEEDQKEHIDWASYLREDETEYCLDAEEPLSDWSGGDDDDDDNESGDTEKEEETEPHIKEPGVTKTSSFPPPAEIPSLLPCPSLAASTTPRLQTLEQLHLAKSWLSTKTHLQYWGPKRLHEVPGSKHPHANVAKMWNSVMGAAGGERQRVQQLSEWSVMREVAWSLMVPASSHVFLVSDDCVFSVREGISISSFTPSATKNMLEYLCEPLQQLRALNNFLEDHITPQLEPSSPSTVMAYVSGLQHWRQAFTQHLRSLEDAIKGQESASTLLWMESEVLPWVRAVATLHTLHTKAFTLPPHATNRTVAVRLLGCVCEAVESAEEERVRGMLLRLLLHTIRPYLAIMHTWLVDGALTDHAQEFIIHRDDSVTVYDERFWREGFAVGLDQGELNQSKDVVNPIHTILRLLAPLLSILTSVGKSQELLAALDVPRLALKGNQGGHGGGDCSLEEVVVQHVRNEVSKSLKADGKVQEDCDGSNTTITTTPKEDKPENLDTNQRETSEKDTGTHTKELKTNSSGESQKKRSNANAAIMSTREESDPLLWAAFNEESPLNGHAEEASFVGDHLESLIEGIGDIGTPISVVSLLSSALKPLVRRRQVQLSAELTRVLLSEHRLALHCQAVCSVLLMEAGDVMHEFYTHLFSKLDTAEMVDSVSLTLQLQDCVSRHHPDLAQYFSVSLLLGDADEHISGRASPTTMLNEPPVLIKDSHDLKNERVLLIDELKGSVKCSSGTEEKTCDSRYSQNIGLSLTKAGIPSLQINYQAPWPANLLLTEPIMKLYNKLFNFSLSLKRVTNGLERLKFRELSSWSLITHWEAGESSRHDSASASDHNKEGPVSPLQYRLHRLQLLRQWLLCFSRELHDHFANTAFLPFHQEVDKLFSSSPPLNTIVTEHERLLDKLAAECLMGREEKIQPLQIALNKVFWLTQQLGLLWQGDVSRVTVEQLTTLESHYSKIHRYLVNFLTTLVSRSYLPHLEGLTHTLVDTVPLLTHL